MSSRETSVPAAGPLRCRFQRRPFWRSIVAPAVTLAVVTCVARAQDSGFHAGTSVREIPLGPGSYMGQFPVAENGVRKSKVATGVRDPLFIKTVVMQEGAVRLALTATDMCFIPADIIDEAKRRVAGRIAIEPDKILIGATHNHSNPSFGGIFGLPPLSDLRREIAGLIAETIIEASGRLEPADVGTGHGWANLNRNRRYIRRDGSASAIPAHLRKVPRYFGPVDHDVGVIRVDTKAGKPLALLVNYTGHPTIITYPNYLYSAEYPGAMVRHVTPRLSSPVPILFFNGAAGNVEPMASLSDDWEWMERTGRELGDEVLRVYGEIATRGDPGLKVHHRSIPFASRYEGETGTAHLHLIALDQTVIATAGGELFTELGLEFKRRSPFVHTMVFGYTDGWLGYIPHRDAYVHGGYGVDLYTSSEDRRTQVPIGFGETILEAWLSMMYTHAAPKPLTAEPSAVRATKLP